LSDARDKTPGQSQASGSPLTWAIAFAALGALVLGPALTGGFFADDWELHLVDPGAWIARSFFTARPYEMYRPLQLLLVAISQTLFGHSTTLPVHLVNLGAHAALAVVVLRALESLGAPRTGAWIGGLYLTVSQLAASSVGGNDTISLTLATLAGSVALFAMSPLARRARGFPLAAVAAYVLALLSKESSLGYLPLLCLLAWLRFRSADRGARKAALVAVCLVAITAVYLAVRASAGGTLPDFAAGDQMRVGGNLPRNAALLGVAAVVPIPTTWIYLGAVTGRWLWPIAGGISALAVVAFVFAGLARAGRLTAGALWLGASATLLAPVLSLVHVSELYAYAALPFTALVFGWSAGSLLDSPRLRPWAAAFVAFVLVSNGWAAHQDAVGLARSGAISGQLMPELIQQLNALPPGGSLVEVERPPDGPTYSGFQSSGFALVTLTYRQIHDMTGRSDVQVLRVSAGEPLPDPCAACVFVTLSSDDRLVPLERGPIP
jgi:hypothetical protein